MGATLTTSKARSADGQPVQGNVFALELRRWRDVRGFSRNALAKAMGYDRSYVSKVESGAERPSKEFAAHAEIALRAGGALSAAFREYEASRVRTGRAAVQVEATDPASPSSPVVERGRA